MEVHGNIEELKKAVAKKYELEINKIKADTEKAIKSVHEEHRTKLDALKDQMKQKAHMEVQKAYAKVLSSEKLAAKKAFEERREHLISQVFEKAQKAALEVAHSDQYKEYVKKHIPTTEFSVVADSEQYKDLFKDVSMEVDPHIAGVKLQAGNTIIDLTLDGAIASRKEVLRHGVSKVLFM